MAGLELLAVEVDHHRADLAPVDERGQRALLRHDHRADLVPARVIQGPLVPAAAVGAAGLAVQGDQADRRTARRVVREDDRRERARRHRRVFPAGERCALGQGTARVDMAAEIVADDAGADDRPRLHPLAARRLDHTSLHPRSDVLLDARRRHPAVEGQDLHGGAPEDRQDIHRDRVRGEPAQQRERERHDRHGDGITQRGPDQSIHRALVSGLRGPRLGRGTRRVRSGDDHSCRGAFLLHDSFIIWVAAWKSIIAREIVHPIGPASQVVSVSRYPRRLEPRP